MRQFKYVTSKDIEAERDRLRAELAEVSTSANNWQAACSAAATKCEVLRAEKAELIEAAVYARAAIVRAAATGKDDDGADPTTTELLKPCGNGGVVSADVCFNALLLVGDVDTQAIDPDSWTQAERNRAYDWAVRVHLKASDNDDVLVPPRPHYVPRGSTNA
jgi:hypothetical protein